MVELAWTIAHCRRLALLYVASLVGRQRSCVAEIEATLAFVAVQGPAAHFGADQVEQRQSRLWDHRGDRFDCELRAQRNKNVGVPA